MGEGLVSSFLRSKLSSILLEAEADSSTPYPLRIILSRFRSIEGLIKDMSDNSSSSYSGDSSPILVDLLHDLIDALSECRVFVHEASASRSGFYFFRFLLFRRKMSNRLDEIETRLKESSSSSVTRDSHQKGSLSELVIQQTYPINDPSLIIGFEPEAKQVESWLLSGYSAAGDDDQGFTAIGIAGSICCGKTALAQKVFASPTIQKEFSPRIWVCLSNSSFDREVGVDSKSRVLKYILEEIGHDVTELEYADYSVAALAEKLQRWLTGKRYLIVLDDVWRRDEWYSDLGYRLPRDIRCTGEFLSHSLPKGSGGAVIVTSRRESVIRKTVGGKHVIRMKPQLSDDAIWEICSDVVRQRSADNPLDHRGLFKMKEDIIGSCDGLPLAAKTLANIVFDAKHLALLDHAS